MAARERWIVARLEMPPLWLVDTRAGGTWSADEDRAVQFATANAAIEAVLAADLFAHRDLGKLWEVVPVLVRYSDGGGA